MSQQANWSGKLLRKYAYVYLIHKCTMRIILPAKHYTESKLLVDSYDLFTSMLK